ncbi:GntR family transcriptional regulator [Streptomyces radicis]|uniref:GntR family transcriptional regulator n=1 Tax=Streptomyces radicis TaxID=1750517 RepID=A0A3A9WC70_9ACTN|nr:GntR family transcriptional regulator [Streptomyces radicis]RKN06964.1 GntR family transcriptional regulator [Streptomyces radicis]RKN15896.1 GntR family transcriptional regulator [Streptomyces radicis]
MESTRSESAISVAVSGVSTASAADRPPLPRRPRSLPERHSVRAQVLAALRDALASGELAPGETYSAPALAERYGVSATPVREAMQRLASEGAVETVPNRGFRVAGRSPRELAELAEVRVALEVPAVLRLGRTLPPERWDELRPLAEATVTAASVGDRAAYAEADRLFHRALLTLTGNRQLVKVAEDLQRKAQCPAELAPLPGATELLADALEHAALLDALRTGDLTAAEHLARAHLTGPTPRTPGHP